MTRFAQLALALGLAGFGVVGCTDDNNEEGAKCTVAADCTGDKGVCEAWACVSGACVAKPIEGCLETCGNGALDTGETCDGTQLGTATCITEGFIGGTLACASDCLSFDTTGCTASPACGFSASLGELTVPEGVAVLDPADSTITTDFDLNAEPDHLSIDLYPGSGVFTGDVEAGTFTLDEAEGSYETCGLCIVLQSDTGKLYMPTGGTVELTSFEAPDGVVGTLTDLTFREVTIDPTTAVTTPVQDGCQTGITSASFHAVFQE